MTYRYSFELSKDALQSGKYNRVSLPIPMSLLEPPRVGEEYRTVNTRDSEVRDFKVVGIRRAINLTSDDEKKRFIGREETLINIILQPLF